MRFLILTLWAALAATMAVAQDNYRIKSGDTLRIEVLEDPQLNREVLVLPDGRFSFPFAGTVLAGGRTIDQVEASITSGIASNFATSPNVFVSVGALRPSKPRTGSPAARTIDIYLLGEVNTPGLLAVSRGTTMLQALAQGGGINKFGASKRVQLRRVDPQTNEVSVYRFNVKSIIDGAEVAPAVTLQAGDVIIVPERRLFE